MGENLIILAVGLFVLFVGYLNFANVRHARKTGIVSGRGETYNRRINPILYKIVFGGSLFSIVLCSVVGIGLIGLWIFLLENSN